MLKIRRANGPGRVRSHVSVPGVVILSLSRDKGAALGGIWAVSAPAEVPPKSRRSGAALRNRKKKRPENDTDFRTAFGPEIAPKSLPK